MHESKALSGECSKGKSTLTRASCHIAERRVQVEPGKVTTVIVDDDEDIRRILRRMMATAGVDVVAELTSGEEAVEWMSDNDARLIIMDVQMAGMGGTEATRRIKSIKPSTTIFGFTGWGEDEANAMVQAGATEVFQKTKLPELIAAIEAST